MGVAIITGSAGLVGSEVAHYFSPHFEKIIGIDNNAREYFFGKEGSTLTTAEKLKQNIKNYEHHPIDIQQLTALETVFKQYSSSINLIIHAAAQPSHDWAAKAPLTDFSINALGTLHLLELTRTYCPKAVFIFVSTNKVYGDRPNQLPFVETTTRYTVNETHTFHKGIDEGMNIDSSMHSLFGVSKLSADIMTQEYARYFGLTTGVFRAGCITGGKHAGVELHGFLSYLVKCALSNKPYTIYGYKGKQVRDILHAKDLANAFYLFYKNPKAGEVYNIGGGINSNCSILEAMASIKAITGKQLQFSFSEQARLGDHQWYISNVSKFQNHFNWKTEYNLDTIIKELAENA